MSDEVCWLSVGQIARLYRRRELSPRELVDAFIARIERHNPALNAYVFVIAEEARAAARRAEAALMRSDDQPPLHGIPFSVKDNIPTGGVRSTSGSLLFKDSVPAEDAAVVANVKRAGGILLGKTNTPAFGWMGVTYNKIFGWTPNPWNPEYIAGGSSGGAAVAAATALAPINIGTDGGGSLRTPAAFTETVGYKPSFGRVPNYPGGNNWSVQHLGPVARSVEDVAIILNACATADARDLHSLPPSGEDFSAGLATPPKKLSVVYAH